MTTNNVKSLGEALLWHKGRLQKRDKCTGDRALLPLIRGFANEAVPTAKTRPALLKVLNNSMYSLVDTEGKEAIRSIDQVRKISQELGELIPKGTFWAETQGFLLKRKKSPRKAWEEATVWTEAEGAQVQGFHCSLKPKGVLWKRLLKSINATGSDASLALRYCGSIPYQGKGAPNPLFAILYFSLIISKQAFLFPDNARSSPSPLLLSRWPDVINAWSVTYVLDIAQAMVNSMTQSEFNSRMLRGQIFVYRRRAPFVIGFENGEHGICGRFGFIKI
ncbi:mitochondrial chaperone BCS1 [Fusarium mundagurra]|uniref:Mitochondrial chaperone BCS1 n=1 Tax=Fusarium mundagurra TaxID=1567541 RepID=A0A8H5Z8C9_9HYPO|nr:mitochondrial chaperone BCS1 [Fusarium mundagurra]